MFMTRFSNTSSLACRKIANFAAKNLQIIKTTKPKELPNISTLGFGGVFTDHLLDANFSVEKGWESPRILPYDDFKLDPSSSVFHYGICCFEGLKAYVDRDHSIRMFRPMKNMERFNISMKRLGMQTIPGAEYLECIKQLVRLDRRWIPDDPNCSLYIRPCAIGTEAALGVHESHHFKVFTILSPSGPYYKTGMKPIKIMAESHYARAWPGGIGFTKAGGNYAPTIAPAAMAEAKGYGQILWLLDGNITEGGAMNIMVNLINEDGVDEVVTAPLDGTILPGVTRDSVLQILRKWDEVKVSERKMNIEEITKAANEHRLKEIFCTGTAAVLTPIGCIAYEGKEYMTEAGNEIGTLTNKLYHTLTGIQRGVIPNPFPKDPWSIVI